MKDLLILAADKDLEFALNGILSRPEALGIRRIDVEIIVHFEHDPACARDGVEFLNMFTDEYHNALLMFDHEGSGKEAVSHLDLEESLNLEFTNSAWGNKAKTIVLTPELEIWIWSNSPQVDNVTGWRNRSPRLRPWLIENGWLVDEVSKPERPKEAFIAALRESGMPRSSSLYEQIASSVSLTRCRDESFLRFKNVLQAWFPAS